jgi:hypothetical protein
MMKKFGLLFVLVIPLVFTASCVSKEVPFVTWTYYETAYRTGSYTTTENVVVNTKEELINLTPIYEWKDNFTVTEGGGGIGIMYYKGYRISSAQGKVTIRLNVAAGYIMVFDLTGYGQVRGLRSLNDLAANPHRVLYSQSMNQTEINFDSSGIDEFAIITETLSKNPIISVQFVGSIQTVESRIVMKEGQVPYQAEKQRIDMQTIKVPFWEVIFH